MADYSDTIEDAGRRFNVKPALIKAVMMAESGGDPKARSRAGAIGLMQIMPDTARRLGVDASDPVQSIYGAANLLSQHLDHYGNVPDALRAYNAGTDRSHWTNTETSSYPGRVASYYAPDPHREGNSEMAPKQEKPKQAGVDVGAMDRAWGVSSQSNEPETPTVKGSSVSVSDMDKAWGVGQPEATSAEVEAPKRPGFWQNVGAGLKRGVRDVGDTALKVGEWADRNLPGPDLDAMIGADEGKRQKAMSYEANALTDYNRDYGGSVAAGVGRIGGNMLASAPFAGPAGDLAGAAIGAGARGAGLAGGLIARGTGLIGRGAAEGATANAASSGGGNEDIGTAALHGAEIGAIAAPVLAAAGGAINRGAEALTGGRISQARAALAQRAKDLGIELTAPQIGTSSRMRYLADEAGGGHTTQGQINQFTRAVSRTFGADSDSLTPDVLAAAQGRIGARMDRVAHETQIRADDQFVGDLARIEQEAQSDVTPGEITPIRNRISDVLGKIGEDGHITGAQYQALTRANTPLARAMAHPDPNIAYHAGRVRDALDEAMERSLVADGRQDLLAELRDARLQYKNLKTIEPLATKAGANEHAISPPLLQGRVNTQFRSRAQRGAGDLGDLADIGQAFMKAEPNSGTAGRSSARLALSEAPMMLGAALTGHTSIPEIALAASVPFIAGAPLRAGIRTYMDNPLLAQSLIKRGAHGEAESQWRKAASALVSGQGAVTPALDRTRKQRLVSRTD